MADARVIPLGDGDRNARLAASRAARKVGATGPAPARPRRARTTKAAEPDGGYAEPDQVPAPEHLGSGHDGLAEPRPEGGGTLVDWLDFLRRRLTGEYAVDDIGFDAELTDRVLLAALRPLYQHWFRVQARGLENIPDVGGALVVANHSGTIALDALMTQLAVHDHHPGHRDLRLLGANLVFSTPFLGELARKGGHTLACNPDAERLLTDGQVVGVWPEGFKGVGKAFADRYKLQRFGRGGFVAAALRARTPIIPCAIVGAEEIYPMIGNAKTLARLLGLPYFPITPTFPWLGPLGLVPLPSRWVIEFGEPIHTDHYPAGAADDPMLVFNLTDQVRETIQQTLYRLLVQRRGVFT